MPVTENAPGVVRTLEEPGTAAREFSSEPAQSVTVVVPAPSTSSVPFAVIAWCATVALASCFRTEPPSVSNATGSVMSQPPSVVRATRRHQPFVSGRTPTEPAKEPLAATSRLVEPAPAKSSA